MPSAFVKWRERRQRGAVNRAEKRRRGGNVLRGLLLILALLLCCAGPIFFADAITYVPLIMVLLLVVVSIGSLVLAVRGVRVDEESLQASCERGSSIPLSVTFSNRSFVPVARLEVSFFISDLTGGYDATTRTSMALAPREELELIFKARFAHLGSYQVGVDHIIIHDMLGMFSKRIDYAYHEPIDVRPRLFDVGDPDLTHVAKNESRNFFRPIVSDDMDYSGVREYRPGDPLKTVHWNLTARDEGGRMYTRLFEVFAEPGLAVIVDPYTPDYGVEDLMGAFDALVESAASISRAAREMGVDAEIRYLGNDGSPSATHLGSAADADALVHTMLAATPAAGALDSNAAVDMLLSEARASQGRGNVAFCTSRLDDEAARALIDMRMRRRNPMLFMAVPRSLEGKRRKETLRCLTMLAEAGVPYYVIETSETITEVGAA